MDEVLRLHALVTSLLDDDLFFLASVFFCTELKLLELFPWPVEGTDNIELFWDWDVLGLVWKNGSEGNWISSKSDTFNSAKSTLSKMREKND